MPLKESFEVGNLSGFQTNINSSLIMITAENILNNGDHKIFYVEKNNNDFQVELIIKTSSMVDIDSKHLMICISTNTGNSTYSTCDCF